MIIKTTKISIKKNIVKSIIKQWTQIMTKINKNTAKTKVIKTNKALQNTALQNKIEIYQDPNNKTEIKLHFDNETFQLSQNQIAKLFARDRTVISKHIRKVFDEDELEENSNVQKMHFANSDKPTMLYSLDMIISVGYRVNSKQGTKFRIWATERLKNYLVQGFAINKKRVLEYQKNLGELQKTIKLIQNSVDLTSLKYQ